MQQRKHQHQQPHHSEIAITIGAVVILGLGYAGMAHHYKSSSTFMPNTTVAGTNVGGKNATQAQQLIEKHLSNQKLNLTANGKVVKKVSLADAGLNSTSRQSITSAIKSQNPWTWPLQLMDVANAADTPSVNLDQAGTKKLNDYAQTAADQLNQKLNSSTNSTGHVVSPEILAQQIQASTAKGAHELDLKNTYYSKKNNAAQVKLQRIQAENEKITYDVNGNTVVIPQATLKSWLKIKTDAQGQQKLSVDQSKVKAYLADLNQKYATYGADVTFNSTKRGTQTVKDGIFGWSINTTADAANLSTNILKGASFTQKATIVGSGQSLKKGELGTTYVEVDKTNQHMWYYKDGKLQISTDVVTGKPSGGNTTPTGVFYVWNKQRNATLRGKNDDGSNYASPVNYWMPIDYTGVGLHDASWQPKFGGDWYKTHGSHGCVNTPPATMKKLFEAVPVGTPVVVF